MSKLVAIAVLLVLVQASLAAPKKWPYSWPEPAGQCMPKVDEGQKCKAVANKWAYNPSTNTCKEFKYGGCKGNTNRFDTEFDCRISCIPLQGAPPPQIVISPPIH